MVLSFSGDIRFVRGFRSIKTRYAKLFSVCHYLHTPFTLMRGHTKITTFVGLGSFSHILQVFKTRYFTQVNNSVVAFVAVNVVNMLRRPFTRNVKPRQSMRELFFVTYGNRPITLALPRTRYTPNKIGTLSVVFPNKYACASVVRQCITQIFKCAWLFRCHEFTFSIKTAQCKPLY